MIFLGIRTCRGPLINHGKIIVRTMTSYDQAPKDMQPRRSRGRGRGPTYSKVSYGRGARGGRGSAAGSDHGSHNHESTKSIMADGNSSANFSVSKPGNEGGAKPIRPWSALNKALVQIDNQSYPKYKNLYGRWQHSEPPFLLNVDHVQSDPYAPPSRVRIVMDISTTGIPFTYLDTDIRRIALTDYLTRKVADYIRQNGMDAPLDGSGWHGPKGGDFNINAPGQEVLERTSCVINNETKHLELRFSVKLPARGRTVLGQQASTILCQKIPSLAEACLLYDTSSLQPMAQHIKCVELQDWLRDQIKHRGLVAFIANGSILPRKSGAQSLPMTGSSVVPFKSPEAFEIPFKHLDDDTITGMGIPTGVSVLTGGGFHGKSTVLEAIQAGVYNHIPGDGRELVVTDPTALKIRAEDGRCVTGLDISPFISNLPGKQDTTAFTSSDASGSSSMVSNIQEALELGSKLLLIDEDTAATNLLVCDERMRALIQSEPITPFVNRVRALFKQHGVSTIIVIGGCGDYLSVADQVIGMTNWLPADLTQAARDVVARHPALVEPTDDYGRIPRRRVRVPGESMRGEAPIARGMAFLETKEAAKNAVENPAEGRSGIDLSCIEQLVEVGQARFIAEALFRIASGSQAKTVSEGLDELELSIAANGLDSVHSRRPWDGEMVRARKLEIGAALNRLRSLSVDKT